LNETESALLLTLADLAGNSLAFNFPRVKYTGDKADVQGEGSRYQVLPFKALYDYTTNNSNIVITRTAHV